MSFLNRHTLPTIALLSFSLFGCAAGPKPDRADNPAQMNAISLWHQCVDENLQLWQEDSSTHSPDDTIEHTLIACRGYREDVLATFPQQFEQPLDKLMVRQTYQAGYSLFAEQNGIALPISPQIYDTLVQGRLDH